MKASCVSKNEGIQTNHDKEREHVNTITSMHNFQLSINKRNLHILPLPIIRETKLHHVLP